MKRLLSYLLMVVAFGLTCGRAWGGNSMISIDLKKSGAAINPNLYGQFIEHLGRCIYGGIWAEMIQDRKFLLDPGKSWEVVKPKGSDFEARHDAAGAYAGAHCMALVLGDAPAGKCGVRQGNLGVIAGKEYVGYVILANVGNRVPVEIRLAWGSGPNDGESFTIKNAGSIYRKFPFRFRARATTNDANISILIDQPGYVWVGGISLMPADNRKGMRPDTLKLIKELDTPIMRWPGGNFVSGYDWKDGIGDRDRRPPRWERAWNAVESNDVGIDEFMTFCREIETEPYIAVNTGLGSVESALQELEYVNGSVTSRWGEERARNGHAKPYGVIWWGIGNEMYGDWQLGNVSVDQYALRNNAFVNAMRKKDRKIKIVAVGATGRWNDVIVPACAGHMNLLSAHHYTLRKMNFPFSKEDAKKYRENFPEYSGDVARGIRRLVDDLRGRVKTGNRKVDAIRLSIDEWGLVRDWNQKPDPLGLGSFETYYPLGDAIAIARGLHEIIRSADMVDMANWAQTVNVIGLIKTNRTHAVMGAAGHAFVLYRAHLGGVLAPVSVPEGVPVDAVGGWDRKTGIVSVGLINYSMVDEVGVTLDLSRKVGRTEGWRIGGDGIFAINAPGKDEQVTITPLGRIAMDRAIVLPPLSITLVKIRLR